MEQLTFESEPDEAAGNSDTERSAYLRIYPRLATVAANNGIDPVTIQFNPTTAGGTIKFGNFTAFQLKLHGRIHFINISILVADIIPKTYQTSKIKSDPLFIRVMVTPECPLAFYDAFLEDVMRVTIDRYPKEYDCCSRFLPCSDARTCIHPDKAFALGCGYRKILNSGRIFIGKNRNID